MMSRVTKDNAMNFTEFRKWLDINPGIRKIVMEALRPNLFTIINKEQPCMKTVKGDYRHGSFHSRVIESEEDFRV